MTGVAVVVGGGLGGAAAAATLAKQGFRVSLFERSPELREIGAGIFLKENSLRVLESLGQFAHIERTGTRLHWGELWGRGAHKMLTRPIKAHRVYVLPRRELHTALITAAQSFGVTLVTDAEVVDVEARGGVVLHDGRRFEADLVVGADGIHSIVRDRLGLGLKVTNTGAGSWRTIVPFVTGDPVDGVIEYWNGCSRILVVPAGVGLTYLCASSRDDDPAMSGARFDKTAWSSAHPEFRDLIARVNPETMVRHQHSKSRVAGWHRDRVAILGDAVHGQPPNLGQGAGLAIANAASLARHLTSGLNIPEALARWEADERAFTEAVQAWSNKYDEIVHRWPKGLQPVRNALVGLIGRLPPTKRRWAALGQGLPELLTA